MKLKKIKEISALFRKRVNSQIHIRSQFFAYKFEKFRKQQEFCLKLNLKFFHFPGSDSHFFDCESA